MTPIIMRGLLLGAATALALSGCATQGSGSPAKAAASTTSKTKIQQAVTACGISNETYASVGDGGKTLLWNGASQDSSGNEDPTSGGPTDKLACVLVSLGTTTAVISQMTGTTAMQGRQEGSWEGFNASWTFHPDNGLDIIVQEK